MPPMRNRPSPLDFIEFFQKSSQHLIEILEPLYNQGLSITDIAEQTGLKRHTVWQTLKRHIKRMRNQSAVPFNAWSNRNGKTNVKPPYGYSFFQGVIIRDPKEYPILQFIQNQCKQGVSISSIVRKLDEKGIYSRMNKPWSYNVIKSIIQRLNDGAYKKLNKDIEAENIQAKQMRRSI